MRRTGLIIAVVLAAVGARAWAQPAQEGMAAYARGDFATAWRLLRPLAEQGDGLAQEGLGFLYHDGEGVSRDYVKAYMWFYLAASNLPADGQSFQDAMEARDLTAQLMTVDQIAEARAMARKCQSQNYQGCD